MESSEIRVGNILRTHEHNFVTVDALMIVELSQCEMAKNVGAFRYGGIPLSEEILLKCGFVNKLNSSYYSLDWFEVSFDQNGNFYYDLFRSQVVRIKYVHQLQNLVYVVMQSELNLHL